MGSNGSDMANRLYEGNSAAASAATRRLWDARHFCLSSGMLIRPLLLATLATICAHGAELQIEQPADLNSAMQRANPGDVLVLPGGEWRDALVVFEGRGLADAPITLKGAPQGKTIFSGKTTLRIAGEHLVVDGIHFRDPDPGRETIEFRNGSKRVARNCRLTNCAVTQTAPAPPSVANNRWVNLYGADNRVDHCSIQGKTSGGATLVVWLGSGNEGGHRIDHNYFGPREKLGRNGGETIRVGDSRHSMQSARCMIEQNFFERCDGEAECISNKSCDNIYRGNLFRAVSGALTLRHGNRCIVEANIFLGEDGKGTGGIRVIGEGHVIRGNYLEGLTGNDARAAISLMMGVPGSAPHEYFQVKRARIEANTLVECKSSILIGLSDHRSASLPPVEVTFLVNRVVSSKRRIVEARCALDGVSWSENVFLGAELGIPPTEGIAWRAPEITPPIAISREETGAGWLR